MTSSTFRVLFYANGSKEKNGIVPIMKLQSTEWWCSSVALVSLICDCVNLLKSFGYSIDFP